MLLPNPLLDLMQTPLPSKRVQRKKKYHPSKEEVTDVYQLLNTHIFDGRLTIPSINLRNLNEWGLCIGFDVPRHYCKIKLNYRFFCAQWFIMILAHEMAHQVQWELHGPKRVAENRVPLLSHGPTFYEFKAKMLEYGIPLKSFYCDKKWFKTQDLLKL